MPSEKIFPVDPGTTGIDTSDFEIVVESISEQDFPMTIRKKSNPSATFAFCPSICHAGKGFLESSNAAFFLESTDSGFKVTATGDAQGVSFECASWGTQLPS